MTMVSFDALPDDARVWVFGAGSALDDESTARMLDEVDAWLAQWQAHGQPLTSAREWRDGRFLAVGVDQSMAGASGCSIDALFRILRELELRSGTTLLAGGRVFFRDGAGEVQCVDRPTFAERVRNGAVGDDTPVFDTTVTQASAYRRHFERPMQASWHAQLV